MSYNPGRQLPTAGAPGYARQTSYDGSSSSAQPSPLINSSGFSRHRAPPSSQQQDGGYGGVHRRTTVRGAVPGTVREIGAGASDNRLSMAPNRALTRGKTLTRPDRFVAPAPLINPGLTGANKSGAVVSTTLINGVPTLVTKEPWWEPWSLFVEVSTFWAPRWLLNKLGKTDPLKQRAWKEKCALCEISMVMMGIIGFITIGLNRTLCPSGETTRFTRLGTAPGELLLQVMCTVLRQEGELTMSRRRLGRHQRLDVPGLCDNTNISHRPRNKTRW